MMGKKMRVFQGRRFPDGRTEVLVQTHDKETSAVSKAPLPHLVYHSPDGFEWGYAGSGPSDLARSIVGYLLGEDEPSARVYQHVKAKLIAPIRNDSWLLDEWRVVKAMAEV
jgi:hypothetical protein